MELRHPTCRTRRLRGRSIQTHSVTAFLRSALVIRLPIYVTENGFGADSDAPDAAGSISDEVRIDYLKRYIAAMHQAIAEGADVRGYFVFGVCALISNGARALAFVSVSSISTTRRCAAYPKHRFTGTPISSSRLKNEARRAGGRRLR